MRIRLQLAIVCLLACVPKNPGPPSVDCLAADQKEIQKLIVTWVIELTSPEPDWPKVEQQAIAAGVAIGGCALAEIVQMYLAPPAGRAAPSLANGNAARATLEHFRAVHAGGATFRGPQGDL